MNKVKLFIENFIIYGIGGVISRIIPLIMLPVVTRIMPGTEYFGLSDMSHTIVTIASYIGIMGMYDAMYRMFFEKEEKTYKITVCSTTLFFTLGTSAVICLGLVLLKSIVASFFFGSEEYEGLVYITAIAAFASSTNGIVSAPTRMQNKRFVFLVTNIITSLLSYSISIPLLLKGYYVVALPLANCITAITIEISFGYLNKEWFNYKAFDFGLLKELLGIAIPLFPNFLVYWVFNSSDRIMITRLIGIGESGIYAVGSKLGLASQLIYTAFAGGWQYFAFSTMKEKNQVKTNSLIFEYLGCFSLLSTLGICAIAKTFFRILFNELYWKAFIVSPYLFLAPLLQMLYQIEANQFLVVKKTWPSLFIMSIGALINVFLNYLLIPVIGIEGAAIATLAGYIISVILCSLVLYCMKLFIFSYRFIITCLVFIILFIGWRVLWLQTLSLSLFLPIVYFLAVVYLYRLDIIKLLTEIRSKRRSTI